jgi:polyphosphate glucokinase
MANREKDRRAREFDLRTFLVAVVVPGVLIAVALWLLVAVRGHRMLPSLPNREPHSQPGQPRSGVAPSRLGDVWRFALCWRPIHRANSQHGARILKVMKVLVIDIGGTNIKVASSEKRIPLKIPSGPTFTAAMMVRDVLAATAGWEYDCISIGYPGPTTDAAPRCDPHNLAPGWIHFDYAKAFGKPLRFLNDAAMQALGGYQGGRMLFLGTGTGLGSALIFDGTVIPLELAHLPYRKGRTYEEYIGLAGLERRGKQRWRRSVLDVIERLKEAFVCDYILLGGGNAKLMRDLPPHVLLGANDNAILGGIEIWNPARRNGCNHEPMRLQK